MSASHAMRGEWTAGQQVAPVDTVVVGLFPGEGIGPELVTICERFLRLLEERGCFRLQLSHGGPIGIEALRRDELRCGALEPFAIGRRLAGGRNRGE